MLWYVAMAIMHLSRSCPTPIGAVVGQRGDCYTGVSPWGWAFDWHRTCKVHVYMCKQTTDDLSRNFVCVCGESQDLVQKFAQIDGALIIQTVKSPPYLVLGVGRDLDRCITSTFRACWGVSLSWFIFGKVQLLCWKQNGVAWTVKWQMSFTGVSSCVSHLHVLLIVVSWPADVEIDSTIVQESSLLACALHVVALSCLFHCFCCSLSYDRPFDTPFVVVVIFPTTRCHFMFRSSRGWVWSWFVKCRLVDSQFVDDFFNFSYS